MTKILITDYSEGYTQADNLSINNKAFWNLLACVSLADSFPETTIAIRSESPPTDYFVVGSMIVVSRHLKQTLESLRANVEFFKLHVQSDRDDFAGIEYYCCNILDRVDCIDYSRSKLTFYTKPGFTDWVDGIDELAIDEAIAVSHVIFRIAKGAEYIVCVNDRLADSLTHGGFSGCKCISPEDWYFGCV